MNSEKQSGYLLYLPGIYQKDIEKGAFFGEFLKIFEKLLSGIDDGTAIAEARLEGIEEVIDRIYEFFDPKFAPSEFLKWLAGWMALVLRDDWSEVKKRRLIRRIMSLYRIRGTKKGLEEYIKIYVENTDIEIKEIQAPFQIGLTSTIGKDTYLGGGAPHFFLVRIILNEPNLKLMNQQKKAVRAIIDLEKPAHTYYRLETFIPTFQIGKFSTIGKNTIIRD